MGMQVVRVPTARGTILLASDAAHYFEHWVRRIPFAICWSQSDLMHSYAAFDSLADSEDHVIAGHDPLVRALYPPFSPATGDEVVCLDIPPTRPISRVIGS